MSKIDDTIKQVRKQVDKEQAILVTNPLKFKKALCKYMPLQEYASFKEGKSLLAENNAIAFRNLIYKYKSTASKKSGKPMKHDIRDKAIRMPAQSSIHRTTVCMSKHDDQPAVQMSSRIFDAAQLMIVEHISRDTDHKKFTD